MKKSILLWIELLYCLCQEIFLKWVSKSIQDANQVEAIEVLVDGFYRLPIDVHLMVSKAIKPILFINPIWVCVHLPEDIETYRHKR